MSGLKLSIVFAVLVTCVFAQRPFYASFNSHYPSVIHQSAPDGSEAVGNRVGEGTTIDPYLGSEKQPVYNVDKELLDRIAQYPKDKQPFWYVNAAQLNSIRNQPQPVVQPEPVVQPQAQQINESASIRRQRLQQQQQQQRLQQQQQQRLQQQQRN